MQSFDIKHIHHKVFYAIQVWPNVLFNTFIKIGSGLLVIAFYVMHFMFLHICWCPRAKLICCLKMLFFHPQNLIHFLKRFLALYLFM